MSFKPWMIIVAIVVVIAGWAASGYNGMIASSGNVKAKWATVEASYQRRFDLIPNLVNSVKGASKFEQDTFRQITEARTGWTSAESTGDRSQQIAAAQKLDSIYAGLRINVEAYPNLKATDAYRDLMTQLEGTENRITVAREDYNTAVMEYNIRVMRFPGNILAAVFGFQPETSFQSTPGAENAPAVSF